MKQEEKDLLFKDICARLPYKLYFKMEVDGKSTNKILTSEWISDIKYHPQYYKVYLRPMSSMTREEHAYYVYYQSRLRDGILGTIGEYLDWLNKNMFDYRGLIPMGLALEATEGMYKLN